MGFGQKQLIFFLFPLVQTLPFFGRSQLPTPPPLSLLKKQYSDGVPFLTNGRIAAVMRGGGGEEEGGEGTPIDL